MIVMCSMKPENAGIRSKAERIPGISQRKDGGCNMKKIKHNPSILGFSYSFSYMGFGVNYTSSGTIYQASTIITLSY